MIHTSIFALGTLFVASLSFAGEERYHCSLVKQDGAARIPSQLALRVKKKKAWIDNLDADDGDYVAFERDGKHDGAARYSSEDKVYGLKLTLDLDLQLVEGASQGQAVYTRRTKGSIDAVRGFYSCQR